MRNDEADIGNIYLNCVHDDRPGRRVVAWLLRRVVSSRLRPLDRLRQRLLTDSDMMIGRTTMTTSATVCEQRSSAVAGPEHQESSTTSLNERLTAVKNVTAAKRRIVGLNTSLS